MLFRDKSINNDKIVTMTQMSLAIRFWLKASALAILMATGLLIMTTIILGLIGWSQFSRVANRAQISPTALLSQFKTGWQTQPSSQSGQTNFLILGTDELESRGDVPPLTDTILLMSLNLKTGQINLLSLPRDLWSQKYLTKINALYSYGQDYTPEFPEQFVAQTISELTQVPINYTLVINMAQVEKIIETIGGVEVDVPVAFIDPEFPKPDVDVTQVFDPQLLYETIEFQTGLQIMSGETAIKYMRSRHSQSDQGTDNDRSFRQQLVFKSMIKQLLNPQAWINTTSAGQLLSVYQTGLAQYLPIPDLVGMGKQLWSVRQNISISFHSLSIAPDQPAGVIFHPADYLYDNQWVYAIKSEVKFPSEVKKLLEIK